MKRRVLLPLVLVAIAGCQHGTPVVPEVPRRGPDPAELQRLHQLMTTRLPANPFELAKKGDWWLYVARTLDAQRANHFEVERAVIRWRVIDEDGDDLLVDETVIAIEKSKDAGWLGGPTVFDKQEAPLATTLFPRGGRLSGTWELTGPPSITTASRQVATGEVVPCTKVTFGLVPRPTGGLFDLVIPVSATAVLWPAKKNALVAFTLRVAGSDQLKVAYELVGFGSGDTAEWGQTLSSFTTPIGKR